MILQIIIIEYRLFFLVLRYLENDIFRKKKKKRRDSSSLVLFSLHFIKQSKSEATLQLQSPSVVKL